MSIQNSKIFLTPYIWCETKLRAVKYDLLSLSSNKHHFFRVNFLTNTVIEHLRMRQFLGSGAYQGVLSRIFCLGGKSILKIIFEPRGGEKNFLGFLGGSRYSPGKF